MPIGSTIKRTTAYTLILCVLTVLICLGCKSEEELDSPVEVSTQSKPTVSSPDVVKNLSSPVASQTAIPFPTLVPLTSTIPIVSKEESLSTVEVVKLLKHSVVHIASGSVSMDIFN